MKKLIPFMMAIFFAVPLCAKAEGFANTLVKSPDSAAVYYVDDDGRRHAFPHQKIFQSWFADFSDVKLISGYELSLLPLGRNVTYRAGTRLIKVPSVSEVYAVGPGARLYNIPSEEAAIQLYGPEWSSQVDDIDISLFFDYSIAGVIDVVDGQALYPPGTIVNHEAQNFVVEKGSDAIHRLRPVTDMAWGLNGFNRLPRWYFQNNSAPKFFERGLPVTIQENQYSCLACATPSDEFSLNTHLITSPTYSARIPAGWTGNIVEPLPELPQVFLALESEQEEGDYFVENLTVLQWEANPNIQDFLVTSTDAADTVYYSGPSLLRPAENRYDVVFAFNGGEFLNWSHIIAMPEAIYELKFTTTPQDFESYIDEIYTILTSFTISQ